MRVTVFSTKPYDRTFLSEANAAAGHELTFLEPRLTAQTARLAEGSDAVCAFVNDDLCAEALGQLATSASGWWRCARPASTTSTWSPPANWG